VLTHDVETQVGYEHIDLLKGVEEAAGHRSSWNLVPRRYDVSDDVVRALQADGFEVGVHGLYHDGRDLESLATLQERLPAIREHAERWGAVGFRSPATHRKWELMPLLGFDYDTSSPDTDPFEPQAGGCCSLLPFFNGELVELPVTLPQDHTLFVILRRDESAWIEKARAVRDRGGMALLITHPDYMLEPSSLEQYRRFLDAFAGDEELWRALPRDVSAWWRRRAASSIERDGDGWKVVGPAAGEAAIATASA
jgi:peptidoglycan/xylan/chitin deacetylase (PgdA/CDA1 family)